MTHATDFAEGLNNKFAGEADYVNNVFSVNPGRKYDKIVVTSKRSDNNKSVYAFVDKETGDLYKAADWSAPAKGVRYSGEVLLTTALEKADLYGSFLYKS